MTDVVVYAGPVIVGRAFHEIEWTHPTEIVPITMGGSSNFQALALSLRSNGRILPALLERYVRRPRREIRKLALCSYSAGWGLLNEIFQISEDRADVDACVLNDSAFGGPLLGYELFAADAIRNRKMMVITNTNNAASPTLGIMKTARETVVETLARAHEISGALSVFKKTKARRPLPEPSGGTWRLGRCIWLDYVVPGSPSNQGNDYTHVEHHDLAIPTWEAYLAPYLAGRLFNPTWKYVLGAAAVGGCYAAYRGLR